MDLETDRSLFCVIKNLVMW